MTKKKKTTIDPQITLETIYAIAISNNAYALYSSTLASLNDAERRSFVDVLLNEFYSAAFNQRYNTYVEEYLNAPVTDIHYILAEKEDDTTDYAQHFANQEWNERQVDELDKILREAQKLKEQDYRYVRSDTLIEIR